jgi:hypothetical protein
MEGGFLFFIIDASQHPDAVAGTHGDVLLFVMFGCFYNYHKKKYAVFL